MTLYDFLAHSFDKSLTSQSVNDIAICMNYAQYIQFSLGALGAFNGLMLGIYFLSFGKSRTLSGFFLGCLLTVLSLRIGEAVFACFDPMLPRIYVQIGMSACLLIGPALFFFTKAAIEQTRQVPQSWKIQIAVLLSAVVIVGSLYPFASYPNLCSLYFSKIIYAVWFIYLVGTGIQLKGILSRMGGAVTEIKTAEKWLLAIFLANIVIFSAFLITLFFGLYSTFYGATVIFSFVLCAIIFIQLYDSKTANPFYLAPVKYLNKKINDAETVLNSLEQVMAQKELFRNPDLTVSELAKAINLPGYQLSQLINDNLGKNFTSYVNEYRINEACRMIGEQHPYSLEAIGYEVGFNSKSTFYAAFKKIRGTTPMFYKEGLLSN